MTIANRPFQNTGSATRKGLQCAVQLWIVLLLLPVFFAAYSSAATSVEAQPTAAGTTLESSDPVLLVLNDWSSQQVLSHIVANLLEAAGHKVEFVAFDSQLQFRALAEGVAHFQVIAWEGPMRDAFTQALRNGMVDAGTHAAISREGWWIPDYVLELCPAASDWRGLNACAALFATETAQANGRFLGPPADWGKNYAQLIEALQMNFRVVHATDANQLWTTLQLAVAETQPIVLFNWTPNFIDVAFTGRFVDFPVPTAACASDPAWGPNPDATGDCGEQREYWLKKAAWDGLQAARPDVWKLLQQINFTTEHIASAVYMTDVDGLSPSEAAIEWIAEHPATVDEWLN